MQRTARAGRAWIAAAGLLAAACMHGPDPTSPTTIAIAGERVFPESITADAAGNLYHGSISGTLYRVQVGSTVSRPFVVAGPENGLRSVFGVLADDARGLLWVCDNPDLFAPPAAGTPAISVLKAFALADGRLVADHPFPEGPAACNDIAIDAAGTVWITETSGGRIFTLAAPGGALALFAGGEELVGVDGIAFGDDGAIYINNVRRQLFQRVRRDGAGRYAGLVTLAPSLPLAGPDGLRPLGGNRFLQGEGGNGRVALLEVHGNQVRVVPLAEGLDGPVGVQPSGAMAYVVEGRIGYLIDPALRGQDPGTFVIRMFPLPEDW